MGGAGVKSNHPSNAECQSRHSQLGVSKSPSSYACQSCSFKQGPFLMSQFSSINNQGRSWKLRSGIFVPSCLYRGALINVEAPGCGTSVVRGPTVHKWEGFHPGVQLYPKVSSPKMPTSRRVHKSLNRVLIKEAILV